MKNLQQLFLTLVFVLGLVSVQAQPNNGFDLRLSRTNGRRRSMR